MRGAKPNMEKPSGGAKGPSLCLAVRLGRCGHSAASDRFRGRFEASEGRIAWESDDIHALLAESVEDFFQSVPHKAGLNTATVMHELLRCKTDAVGIIAVVIMECQKCCSARVVSSRNELETLLKTLKQF